MNHLLTDPDRWRTAFRKNFDLPASAAVGILAPSIKDVRAETDKGKRDVVFVANTADIDLDDEIVLPEGADLSHIQKNGQAFADHQYDLASNVGSIRSTKMEGGRWIQRVFVYDKPGHKELGDDILHVANNGGIGASIGFIADEVREPDDREMDRYKRLGKAVRSIVSSWRWLETSFTAMPCNVSCQSIRSAVIEARIADLDDMVTKGQIRRKSAVLLGLPESPVRTMHPVSPPTRRIVVVG